MATDINGNEIKYSFGLWTVNWEAGDPFGNQTRAFMARDLDSLRKLKDIGADAFTFHDADLFPDDATDEERNAAIDALKKVINETGIVCEMVTTNTFSGNQFKDGAFTSSNRDVRRYGLRKVLRQVDLGAELGATTFVMWGGREGVEYDNSKDLYDAHARYAEGIDTVASYIKQKGYDMRIGLEPKPNEPRGDIFLPSIGHAIALINTLDNGDIVGLNPETGHEQMACLNYTHGLALAMYCGKLAHIDLNGQHGPKYDQDMVFGHGDMLQAFFTVDLLDNGSPNGGIKPYGGDNGIKTAGYRHFDYKPSRTETEAGVWDSARANIEMYELLSKKAKEYRNDPKTQELFKRAHMAELAEPTLAPGESVLDFVKNVQVSDFDTKAMADVDFGLVELHQQALRHLIG
ncbi:MAG: xylose isomerase [Candidatus Ancillula sp.]|jgi:xylose isomerase|nr:xylose isomerase [Candidatus Ancillula sp.]